MNVLNVGLIYEGTRTGDPVKDENQIINNLLKLINKDLKLMIK